MKKLLVLGVFLVLLIASSAYADINVCGVIKAIDAIQLFESNGNDVPVLPCNLSLEVTLFNQPYVIPVTAKGTQLNLALLKAYNTKADLPLNACFVLNLLPFKGRVVSVTFP